MKYESQFNETSFADRWIFKFGRQDSPTICWVLKGDVDITNLSAALQSAILRRAPWLGGRLARTQTSSVGSKGVVVFFE